MIRVLIVFLLLFASNEVLAKRDYSPTSKHAIRKELKRLIYKVNETRTGNDSQWSNRIKLIPYSGICAEIDIHDLSYNPDSTFVFKITEINCISEIRSNDEICIVFDRKNFCKLDLIQSTSSSDQLRTLMQAHFPVCEVNWK